MTPEEYIEILKDAQRNLYSAKIEIDHAIQRMEKRLETGYESMEERSQLAAFKGFNYLKMANSKIIDTIMSKLEYYEGR